MEVRESPILLLLLAGGIVLCKRRLPKADDANIELVEPSTLGREVDDAASVLPNVLPINLLRPLLRNGVPANPANPIVVLTAKFVILRNAFDGVGKDANVPDILDAVRTAVLLIVGRRRLDIALVLLLTCLVFVEGWFRRFGRLVKRQGVRN